MATDNRGVALVDIVAALALSLAMAAMAAPVVGGTLDRERTIVGAQHLAGQLQRARMESLKRSAAVAVRLELVGDRATARLYVDGNGNGVVQRDIDRGTDLPLAGVEWLDAHARDVSLRINQTVTDAGGSGSLEPGSDPLRIGRTALVTFSPLGSSSSGTLYVAAHRGPQMAIRVYGASGRVRVLMFDARTRQWHP
ncbi:MAG: GspH/FimT family pseudopilin [Acidobacteriota bacterium]|nr:GspH/FimT family pseudopilin [Acidobacteriota bacterium]